VSRFYIISLILIAATSVLTAQPAGFSSSNLPIILIRTNGLITDNSRVSGSMQIIHHPEAGINFVTDSANVYNGPISIELHGQSSLMFAKKSYQFETQDSLGENNNVPLLGMPAENDWILHGPYSDKTLMRNALTYTLAGEIFRYAPRIAFCEFVVNNDYCGVYILTEKIKRDKNRIDITEMLPTDLAEPEISGGYIFKKDKYDPGDNLIRLDRGLELIITEPKKDEILPAQTAWLKAYLSEVDQAVFSGTDYTEYIDLQSFADNFLMVEFTKNIDGLRLSTYFYKDRNDKIVAEPVWDYNLALGNADYNDGWTPIGWYYGHILWDNNWWLELIKDPDFYALCGERWKALRQYQFSAEHIFSFIDTWTEQLEQAQQRNFERYPVLGIYVWPNPGFPESGSYGYAAPTSGGPTTWQEEIAFMKEFILGRLAWMDQTFNLGFADISISIFKQSWGQVLYQNRLLVEECFLGTFPVEAPITLIAEARPGCQFVQWEELLTGSISSTWIKSGDIWKYLDNGSDQGTSWCQNEFDDASWKSGASELGYGDGDEATVVSYGPNAGSKYVTTYFRKKFSVADAASYDDLTLYLLRDDGAVVYLNGTEIIRSNMPAGTIYYDTFASEFVDGEGENTMHTFSIDPHYLMEGENVIAAEIHQQNLTSSDISFDLRLTGTHTDTIDHPTVIGTGNELTYYPKANSTLTAVFKPLNNHKADLVINEIQYNPAPGDGFEFLELFNHTDSVINISGYTFASGLDFTFPENTLVGPGHFVLLVQDSLHVSGTDLNVFEWDSDGLADNGELLYLTDSKGLVVDSVYYRDTAPWPEQTSGTGYSLELKKAVLENSRADSWQQSYHTGGSPGKPTIRRITGLFINEFMASNRTTIKDEAGNYADWIELYNAGNQAVDIGGLYLSDDLHNPGLWRISEISPYTTTIQPDSFLLLWADNDTSQGLLHLGFQLAREGESISIGQIVDNEPVIIDSTTYSEQLTDFSFGRYPDGSQSWHTFSSATPGFKNIITNRDANHNTVPGSFKLYQNYPNPFNPNTVIRYDLPFTAQVELSIYDILGQKVTTLVNNRQPVGRYGIEWDASGISSGLYYYIITAGDNRQAKKMILIK